MTRFSRTRVVHGLFVLVVVLGALGVGAYFGFWKERDLPTQGTPLYEDYVEAFDKGVAALDVGQTPIALEQFNLAIDLIPAEPAGWADRGLTYLRSNQPELAAADLNKAHTLAPESGVIEALLGDFDERQGHYAEAAAHYRKALTTETNSLVIKFALARTIERRGGSDSDAEYQKLLEECLQLQPKNLPLLHMHAVTAANRADWPTLDKSLSSYEILASSWSAAGHDPATEDWAVEARKTLGAVNKAAKAKMSGQVVSELNDLDALLKAAPAYARNFLALQSSSGFIDQPLYHFIRLQQPRPSPAAPDGDLTFTPEDGSWPKLDGGAWDRVWPVYLTGTDKPAVFVANGSELRRADADAPVQKFPGGPKSVKPSAQGLLALDWNNDTRTDLLLAGAGGLRFLQQEANGSFSDVTDRTGLAADVLNGDYYGAWAADLEMDGDLDIFLSLRSGPLVVLRNNRDGTFTAIKPLAGVESVRAFVWADFDNDGAPDVAFLDTKGKLHVFANERSGHFHRREVPDNLGRLLAITAADVIDGGAFDLLALREDGAILRLTDKDKGQGWEVAELVRWSNFKTDAVPGEVALLTADLDNNGALDVIVGTSESGRVWLGEGAGKFTMLPAALPGGVAAVADLTGNGRLDLLALDKSRPVRLVNKGTKAYHWQVIRPHAIEGPSVAGDQRINSFGIGGEIELRSGTLVQKRPITEPQVHFGLGERHKPDLLRILWTNGTFQAEFDLAVDAVVGAQQRLKGSCPFLFTWDGKEIRFVTDFLWSTPLGMYINAQDNGPFAQTTEWVKVRGDQLVPRDGYYDVRVQANLWETHFYDYMAMMVVDHPPNTEVFVDERFFFTPTPLQVYVTEPPHAIAHAWDDRGKDVTEIVRAADGKYLDTFGRGPFQGVTRDHWVEVDLGDDAPTDGPLYLLARGWIHPTDSSINKALEKGTHDKPRGLELEVPDGKGGWKVGLPALGFPAGKDKTMVIRLDGITGPGVARHFRLRTNMEIYWDALWYARGLDPKLATQHWLSPTVADLRFRGILEMTQADKSSPELPHYDRIVRRTQHWRDLIGFYTRFGDVRELLAQVDDRYVIMNAGDEIAMRFPVPEGPQQGWQRDFVWACDGWTKDGDYNTHFSKTVLPLPAHDLKTYTTPPGRLQDDPVYKRFPKDWRTYHTRYVTTADYERGLRPWLNNK